METRKSEMRREALSRRRRLGERPIGEALALRAALWVSSGAFDFSIFSIYAPIRGEADGLPLARELTSRGYRCCLPVVRASGEALDFRAWRPGDALTKGAFGVDIPGEEAESLRPQLLFTPLLAFDARGGRLGYGGGFYDRTAWALERSEERSGERSAPIALVGLAYAGQEVEEVPMERRDRRLDWTITERETIGPCRDAAGRALTGKRIR